MSRYDHLHIDVRFHHSGLDLDVAFHAPIGITALIGPSGAGKTTIANMIAGHITPDAGTIRMGQRSLYVCEAGLNLAIEKRAIGYVLQDNLLFPHMTVKANIAYGAQGHNARFQNAIKLLDIEDFLDRYPHQLSGGEQKRVAIARAIAAPIEGLILDEPLSGIDPKRREKLYPYLERIAHDMRIPILFISHQLDEVARLADHVVLLENGRISCAGEIQDVMTQKAFRQFAGRANSGAVLRVNAAAREKGLQHWRAGNVDIITTLPPIAHSKARLRILSRDVALARTRPTDISVLNILAVTITAIDEAEEGDRELTLQLESGDYLLCRITDYSLKILNLVVGDKVFAMIKAVAVLAED